MQSSLVPTLSLHALLHISLIMTYEVHTYAIIILHNSCKWERLERFPGFQSQLYIPRNSICKTAYILYFIYLQGEVTIIDHHKLTLLDMVGRGGFGAVFRGKWVDRKNEVFGVKKCTIGGTQRDPSIPREVDILSTVSDHDHIIAFYGVAFNYPDMFIVTEFAEKGSLYAYLHKDKHIPSRDQSLTWALQVARGMHHLHCHDVIHRDLKSANILISATMDVKLCDFGTARYLPHTTIQTGEAGTYRWMAPEIMEGIDSKISKKCDLFSFAMVAYELLVHKLPYHDTPGDPYVAIKVIKGERPMIPPFVPVYLSALLVECWDADPQKRPSFQYVIDLLSQYI